MKTTKIHELFLLRVARFVWMLILVSSVSIIWQCCFGDRQAVEGDDEGASFGDVGSRVCVTGREDVCLKCKTDD